MRFAFCLMKYFPFGGMQRDFLRIAKACLARGHTIDVYTTSWEGEELPNLALHIVPIKGWQNHTRIARFTQEWQKLVAQKTYDLIVGFNKMPGLDVYFAADCCFQMHPKNQRRFLHQFLPRYRSLLANERAVFAPPSSTNILLLAKKQQQEFMQCYQTPIERFHYLPPGIDKDRVAPLNAYAIRDVIRQEWGIEDTDNLLLMIGSGFKTKGLDRILLGIHSLPPITKRRTKLFVIGKDQQKPFLRLAKKLKITDNVVFLGGRHDVPNFLLAANLLVHPAYQENTGTVLLEALAAGLPVVTTDVCGYAEYIKQANAGVVLASPFKQQDFNQALLDSIVTIPNATWQNNGKSFAKNHDIYSLAERAADVLESIGSQR